MTAQLAALLGAARGVVSSLVVSLSARNKTAAEAERASAEAETAKAEAEKAIQEGEKFAAEAEEIHARLTRAATEAEEFRAEKEQIRSRVATAEANIAYELADPRLLTAYDSRRDGISPFDFTMAPFGEAQAELRILTTDAANDSLALFLPNTPGKVFVWLTRYDYAGAPAVVPVGNAAGARRKLRVQCELRALSAAHTSFFVLREINASAGEYFDVRRERIESEQWAPVDVVFSVAVATDFRLRDRGPRRIGGTERLEAQLENYRARCPCFARPPDPGRAAETPLRGYDESR
jgi:hypothetical protein